MNFHFVSHSPPSTFSEMVDYFFRYFCLEHFCSIAHEIKFRSMVKKKTFEIPKISRIFFFALKKIKREKCNQRNVSGRWTWKQNRRLNKNNQKNRSSRTQRSISLWLFDFTRFFFFSKLTCGLRYKIFRYS